MQLTFLGAAKTVTGSKYLLEEDGYRLLIDCGLFQGLKELRLRNREKFPVDPKSINAVLLTHAHIDHSGYLPLLVKNGFTGKIYCTAATDQLCRILLPDSGRLQEEEAQYANHKRFSKHNPALPLYDEQDAERCLRFFAPIAFHQAFDLNGKWSATFSPAGHILGAACIQLKANGKRIVFSGDLGRQKDLVMRPPEHIREADYLIVESTYGAKLHSTVDPLDQLETVINQTLERRGVLLIPSFAVGRAQVLLYAIYLLKKAKRIPDVPVYLNSPMAIDATGVFCDFQKEHRLTAEECQGASHGVKYVHTAEESKALNLRTEPMILIAASGMATGGRILHHLKAFGPNPRNTILFTGYQAAGTRGDAIVQGKKSVKIHGAIVSIEAQVALIDSLSAHADQSEILTWLSGFNKTPNKTFITHGEPDASAALLKKIEETQGMHCHVPESMERVEL